MFYNKEKIIMFLISNKYNSKIIINNISKSSKIRNQHC